MFLNKLNSYKLTCFGPLLSFFVKMYQDILNQTLTNGKILKSPRKNGKEELKTQETRGKRMKNVPKTPRSERHLCFSHYSNYQYISLLFSISIPISISKFPKSSISISKSIFWRCKFQYQYQNQYFEIVIFNIKININTSKILTFQNFSKFCAMSGCEVQSNTKMLCR